MNGCYSLITVKNEILGTHYCISLLGNRKSVVHDCLENFNFSSSLNLLQPAFMLPVFFCKSKDFFSSSIRHIQFKPRWWQNVCLVSIALVWFLRQGRSVVLKFCDTKIPIKIIWWLETSVFFLNFVTAQKRAVTKLYQIFDIFLFLCFGISWRQLHGIQKCFFFSLKFNLNKFLKKEKHLQFFKFLSWHWIQSYPRQSLI